MGNVAIDLKIEFVNDDANYGQPDGESNLFPRSAFRIVGWFGKLFRLEK